MKYFQVLVAIIAITTFCQCNESDNKSGTTTTKKTNAPAPEKPEIKKEAFTYHLVSTKDSSFATIKALDSAGKAVIFALNRIDWNNIKRADTLIVPGKINPDIMVYTPFPTNVPALKDVKKIIFFSYPIQAFGAYEAGRLVYWGPTSMGRKADTTPTGLHFTNWKAVETHSTVKDEWILKWNFNIMNKDGVGWHLYSMPGFPASHSCLRLLEPDAKYLYDWADQWIQADKENVAAQGTPVIVFGQYAFGQRKPWLALAQDAGANDISAAALEKEFSGYLPEIMKQQQRTDSVRAAKTK